MSGDWCDADVGYMRAALERARIAADAGEIPVGAVVVAGSQIIARGGNRSVIDHDPTAHAEIVALRAAGRALANHRLTDATLYVTLEPCTMCVGALVQARVARLVFGAYDDRAGALGSAIDLGEEPALNHRFEVNGGLLADESADLLGGFFEARRS